MILQLNLNRNTMTKEEIFIKLKCDKNSIYLHRYQKIELTFNDDSKKSGFFQFTEKSDELLIKNEYTFIAFNDRPTNTPKDAIIIKGSDLKDIILSECSL